MDAEFLKNKRNVYIIALFYTFLWGSAFPLVKICIDSFGISDNMSKCLVAGIRFFVSGAALLTYCALKCEDGIKISISQSKYVLMYGVLGTSVQYSLTYIGLSAIEGSKGAVFDQLCVFIIIVSSGLFFKNDSITLKKLIGCLIGLSGIIAVNTEKIGFSFSVGGEGMMILASVCQAAAYFIAKCAANDIQAIKLVGYGHFTGGVILIVFAVINGGTLNNPNSKGIIILLLLAGISSVAYVLSVMPLKYFRASEISVFNLLITVFGVVMSAAVLGENVLRINYIAAFLFVSTGIILVNRSR